MKSPKDFPTYKEFLFYKLGEQTLEATALLNKLSPYMQPEEITLYFDRLNDIQDEARKYINDTQVWLPDRGETYDSKPFNELMGLLNAKLNDATFDKEFTELTARMYEGVEYYYHDYDHERKYKELGEKILEAKISRDLTELKKYEQTLFGRMGMGQQIGAINRAETEDKETKELWRKVQTEFAKADQLVKKLVSQEPKIFREKKQKKI